jgi:hypothetical protein
MDNPNFDFSLQHGARLVQKKNELGNHDPNYLLQDTSGPLLGSIIEGLDDPYSTISQPLPEAGSTPMGSPEDTDVPPSSSFTIPPYKSTSELNKVSALQDEFNKILAQYTTMYTQMSNELMINNNRPELQSFAGKNIKHENNYYHVNNFGFTHEYDNTIWENRSTSCSTKPVDITPDDFGNLLSGPNMGNHQACNVAGYNIHNQTTGEQSWVDIKGVRHIYPKDIWDKRSASCQGTPKSLSETEYQSIPEGTKMDPNTQCNKLNIDPAILTNLAKLNAQLLTLGNQLLTDTTSMVGSNEHIQAEITKVHDRTSATLKRLDGENQQLQLSLTKVGNSGVRLDRNSLHNNIEGAKRSSEVFLRMNYIKYVAGLIFVILLVLFSFLSFPSSKQSTVSSIILILVILVVLFHFWTFISEKLF